MINSPGFVPYSKFDTKLSMDHGRIDRRHDGVDFVSPLITQ
jgi:hypothetical protein